ncbi:unnamed protein product [Amoebophrya sp. A25]|nr:unnamed protein product [Amoebophrya sp. A25]|eukprot:GSA25T00019028001.1
MQASPDLVQQFLENPGMPPRRDSLSTRPGQSTGVSTGGLLQMPFAPPVRMSSAQSISSGRLAGGPGFSASVSTASAAPGFSAALPTASGISTQTNHGAVGGGVASLGHGMSNSPGLQRVAVAGGSSSSRSTEGPSNSGFANAPGRPTNGSAPNGAGTTPSAGRPERGQQQAFARSSGRRNSLSVKSTLPPRSGSFAQQDFANVSTASTGSSAAPRVRKKRPSSVAPSGSGGTASSNGNSFSGTARSVHGHQLPYKDGGGGQHAPAAAITTRHTTRATMNGAPHVVSLEDHPGARLNRKTATSFSHQSSSPGELQSGAHPSSSSSSSSSSSTFGLTSGQQHHFSSTTSAISATQHTSAQLPSTSSERERKLENALLNKETQRRQEREIASSKIQHLEARNQLLNEQLDWYRRETGRGIPENFELLYAKKPPLYTGFSSSSCGSSLSGSGFNSKATSKTSSAGFQEQVKISSPPHSSSSNGPFNGTTSGAALASATTNNCSKNNVSLEATPTGCSEDDPMVVAGLRRELEAARARIAELQQGEQVGRAVASSAGSSHGGVTQDAAQQEDDRSRRVNKLRQLDKKARSLKRHFEQLKQEIAVFLREMKPRLRGSLDPVARLARLLQDYRARFLKECTERRRLHNLLQEVRGNIRVFCRVRPSLPTDGTRAASAESSADEQTDDGVVSNANGTASFVHIPEDTVDEIGLYNDYNGSNKVWQFDRVFGDRSTNADVFREVKELVTSTMDGYNVCIFAYGPTGSGKTYSMAGTEKDPGIFIRTFDELFRVQEARKDTNWTYEIALGILEVYNEELRDLLCASGPTKRSIRLDPENNAPCVPHLTLRCGSTASARSRRGSAQNRLHEPQ